jgi:hypothetical protein
MKTMTRPGPWRPAKLRYWQNWEWEIPIHHE